MKQLERLSLLAYQFVDDRANAVQIAIDLSAVVAGLNGILWDDGKAISFAAAALLAAECAGWRQFSLRNLLSEIRSAERAAP